MKYFGTVLLCLMASSFVMADTLSNLQQQTSHAYEQMKQSERDANRAKKQVEVKEERRHYFKQKLAEAEQELQAAQQAFTEAEKNRIEAKKRWDDYSETLYQKWHQKK